MKIAILDCPQLKEPFGLEINNATRVNSNSNLLEYDVLINPLGRYIDEDIVERIVEFYNKGGIIINLSSYAYTIPYYIKDGVIQKQNNTINVIRLFGMIDSYIPCEKEYLEGKAQAYNDKYKYLEKYFSDVKTYSGVCFLEHNLVRTNINDKNDDINGVFVHNRYESILNLKDENDNVLCSLISKTMEIGRGVIYNFNFDTSNLELGELVKELINKEFVSNIYIYAEPEFSRYDNDEEINVLAKVYYSQKFNSPKDLKILLHVRDDLNNVVYKEWLDVSHNEQMKFKIPQLNEGLYKITLYLVNMDTIYDIKETGVLVISDYAILEDCKKYDRLIVDKNISTEFHTKNGEVVPIHGTTYFVSDVTRRCFVHMNPYLCKKEIEEIAQYGYNVIRSGLWHNPINIYGENGQLTKRGIRAMQTFFYIALKNNITIQFVLGHGELNNWDMESSVVHNPNTREKSMNLVCRFFELFKDYTNVQMDIVNEPSYSRNGAWGIGRPSDDVNELENYRNWLKNKYDNNIEKLCNNWDILKCKIKDFSQIELPKDRYYKQYNMLDEIINHAELTKNGYYRKYNRTEQTINHAKLSDFFDFARESFSCWCKDIREYGRKIAPDMVVLMGRDETIRIPCEQDEYLVGNIDTINWHQWNQNGIVFTEYLLSKVPNSICCGQEHGVYKFERHRGEKSLTDLEISNLLERKILYSLGNFVQWQWQNDPFMRELSENNIGIIRNDGSKMPVVDRLSKLMEKEDKMAQYEKGKELSNTKIFVIHPTSYHFSVDNKIAQQAVRTCLDVLVYNLKQHIYVILEHTLKYYYDLLKDGGNLLILPSACIIEDETWEEIKELSRLGNNILITGSIERDNYYIEKNRIREIDDDMKLMPVRLIEKVNIDGNIKDISFKKCIEYTYAPNIFEKCWHNEKSVQTATILNIGSGKIYYFPLPVELADQEDVIVDLYKSIINKTNTQSDVFEVYDKKLHKNIFMYPQKFKQCTVYTIINEGETDTISFKDLTSNKELKITVNAGRGVKIWMDNKGEVLEIYK